MQRKRATRGRGRGQPDAEKEGIQMLRKGQPNAEEEVKQMLRKRAIICGDRKNKVLMAIR